MKRMNAVALLLAFGMAVPVTQAQDMSPAQEQALKESETARLMAEKAKTQKEMAEKEMEEAKKKAALGQGPIGVPGVPPPLKFDEPVKDIGKVSDETPIQVKFSFTNTTDKPVKITNMTGSCGCTVPQKPAKDVYAPGEKGEVVATFNPANRRGKEVKHVYVDTDYTQSPRVELTFSVETQPRVLVDPANVFMGEVRKGESRSQTVTITGREPGFDVTEAKLSDNSTNFTMKRLDKTEVTDATDGAKLTRITYQVELAPGLPMNAYRSAMAISTTDPKRPNITVQLQASVVGDLRVTPDRVWVVGNQVGMPWTREVRIDHRKGESFSIMGIDASDVPANLKVVYDLQAAPGLTTANSGYVLRISGTTPSTSGILTGKFVLKTSNPDQATIEVPLQGNIQLAAPQQ